MTTAPAQPAPTEHTPSRPDPRALRARADQALADNQPAVAAAALFTLWAATGDPATAGFVSARYEKLRASLAFAPVRVAFLRSCTLEPVMPLLRASGFTCGLDIAPTLLDYGTYAQDILNPSSPIYASTDDGGPHAVVLAVLARDIAPDLWARFAEMGEDDVKHHVEQVSRAFKGWIDGFRANGKAHLIIHLLETPPRPAMGSLDAQLEVGQREAFRRINAAISAAARAHKNVYVLDTDALLARRGADTLLDEKKFLLARLPFASGELIHIAREWLRFLVPIAGRGCKAIVCDLDNTLWGGVIGEDGMDGVRLGPDGAGAAYQRFQRAILDCFERGVILAVNSKNNEADAMEALRGHAGMLIKPDQFASFQINWRDKASNLSQIAKGLNIGLDSLAFLDDNPVERQWVREQRPEVHVLELPEDPMRYAEALRDCPMFERLSLSAEDRVRGRMYAEQRLRSELMDEATSLEDFYRSLDMKVEIAPVTPQSLGRIAQLTQKTNQFNLTTKRYTEQDIQAFADAHANGRDARVFGIRAADRFGDNGIVGVAVLRMDQGARSCEIDSLLLSCRVIGRTIETAFLAFLADEARKAGCASIGGWFLPTKKNAPAKDFYAQHTFIKAEETEKGSRWEFDLSRASDLAWPSWIARV